MTSSEARPAQHATLISNLGLGVAQGFTPELLLTFPLPGRSDEFFYEDTGPKQTKEDLNEENSRKHPDCQAQLLMVRSNGSGYAMLLFLRGVSGCTDARQASTLHAMLSCSKSLLSTFAFMETG